MNCISVNCYQKKKKEKDKYVTLQPKWSCHVSFLLKILPPKSYFFQENKLGPSMALQGRQGLAHLCPACSHTKCPALSPQLCGYSCSSPTPITGPFICYFPSGTPYPPFHLITQPLSSSSFTFQLNHQFLEKSRWSERNSSPSCRCFQSTWTSPSSRISQLHLTEMCVIDTSASPPPQRPIFHIRTGSMAVYSPL